MDFAEKRVQERRMDTGGPERGGPYAFRIEDASFLVLVFIVTLVFAWLVAPYFGAILWGLVAGILFSPVPLITTLPFRFVCRLVARPVSPSLLATRSGKTS